MEIKLDERVIEAIVQANIQAAVVKALGKPEALIESVVNAAMAEKKDSYDRESIFQKKVREAIRKEADLAFQAWLVEQRPAIAALIRKGLGDKSKTLAADIASKMVDRLTGSILIDLTFQDKP